MAISISDKSQENIIDVIEPAVHLSYANMKLILIETYDNAKVDFSKLKFCSLYKTLFPLAVTFLIPLLTSTFNDFWPFKANQIEIFFRVVIGISTAIGVVSIIASSFLKEKSNLENKNKTIDDIMNKNNIVKQPKRKIF